MRTAGGAGALKPLVMLLGAGPGTELAKYAAGAVANVTWDHDENCVEVITQQNLYFPSRSNQSADHPFATH